eukprot:CAMPEP_0119412828 /NCGR_PEP_ID=MMETSP1335-20130426/5123_1 /TAXON_ID=259385 /ORGANISM="Chrysoculter rhomboideus, Strain RCC1486" /LENGTH=209 /DNA_ID=CAMNT_0007437583 /DNA_START=213 /DNA_END=840 /DNA_ORIENTATION=-
MPDVMSAVEQGGLHPQHPLRRARPSATTPPARRHEHAELASADMALCIRRRSSPSSALACQRRRGSCDSMYSRRLMNIAPANSDTVAAYSARPSWVAARRRCHSLRLRQLRACACQLLPAAECAPAVPRRLQGAASRSYGATSSVSHVLLNETPAAAGGIGRHHREASPRPQPPHRAAPPSPSPAARPAQRLAAAEKASCLGAPRGMAT